MKNPLVTKYGSEQRWVNYKLETRKGKQTKVPYSPHGTKPSMASSTDVKTWGTHKEASMYDAERVGIVFTPDQLLLGIDIDHCIEGDKIVHPQAKAIRALGKLADTYTELSPSKTGLHLYLALTGPLALTANKKAPFEIYTSGRYFTVTGIPFGELKDVRTITPAEALEILALAGYPWEKKETPANPPPTSSKLAATELSDEDVLAKMFASKNGDDIQALYEGDLSQHNKDASSADMALLSHFAFWTGKNAAQMEHLWITSPLGKRKKTQTREDYRTRTITNAIAHCKEVYTPQEGGTLVKPGDKTLDLLFTMNPQDKSKTYIQNTENMHRILDRHPDFKGTLRYDNYKAMMERKADGVWRPFMDSDVVDIQTQISILFASFRKVGKEMIFDAITKTCKKNEYDSAADYMRALVWDKTPRLDTWLSKTFGAPDDVLHHKIGSNWIKGLVKRIIDPGCKFDYVLVLEGEQGLRKSTSLSVLAGHLGHVETTMSTDSKDFFMQFQGNAVVEFSEGETLSRTEVKRMKALITVQTDKYRPPYGRVTVDNPRRCVFAMTTNQTEYLKDETGNRRWLPVAVTGNADTEWLAENRDQIFAEAYHRLTTGKETVYEFPADEIIAAQNARRIHDPNAEAIVNWYLNTLSPLVREEGVTVQQVFVGALTGGFQSRPMTRHEEMSVADVLKTVLMLDKRRGMMNLTRVTRWYPTEKTTAMAQVPSMLDF